MKHTWFIHSGNGNWVLITCDNTSSWPGECSAVYFVSVTVLAQNHAFCLSEKQVETTLICTYYKTVWFSNSDGQPYKSLDRWIIRFYCSPWPLSSEWRQSEQVLWAAPGSQKDITSQHRQCSSGWNRNWCLPAPRVRRKITNKREGKKFSIPSSSQDNEW